MSSVEFILGENRKVEVFWVNGPPYLSVCYKKMIEVCKDCKKPECDCNKGKFQRWVVEK